MKGEGGGPAAKIPPPDISGRNDQQIALWNKREGQLRNMQTKMEVEYLIGDLEGAFEEASCGESAA